MRPSVSAAGEPAAGKTRTPLGRTADASFDEVPGSRLSNRDSRPTHGPAAAVEEVQVLRRAARAAVREAEWSPGTKRSVIVELARRARSAAWPWAAQQAVWLEARAFLGFPLEPGPILPPDSMTTACQSLVARGYGRCPCCRRILPTEDELERLRVLRSAAVDEARRREGAVDA
jgi:hypothetical protein